jgi:hypothetical protein
VSTPITEPRALMFAAHNLWIVETDNGFLFDGDPVCAEETAAITAALADGLLMRGPDRPDGSVRLAPTTAGLALIQAVR